MNHKQYKFTVPDIAKAADIPEARVRYAIRTGALVPEDLKNVAAFVASHILDDNK